VLFAEVDCSCLADFSGTGFSCAPTDMMLITHKTDSKLVSKVKMRFMINQQLRVRKTGHPQVTHG
jgi:hypothetical protein